MDHDPPAQDQRLQLAIQGDASRECGIRMFGYADRLEAGNVRDQVQYRAVQLL
jgi:hypothetical protein